VIEDEQGNVTLIGLPWARTFVERYSAYLDHFLEFPGYPGIPEVSPPPCSATASILRQCPAATL